MFEYGQLIKIKPQLVYSGYGFTIHTRFLKNRNPSFVGKFICSVNSEIFLLEDIETKQQTAYHIEELDDQNLPT